MSPEEEAVVSWDFVDVILCRRFVPGLLWSSIRGDLELPVVAEEAL